jgi:hypothetical protein
VSPTKGEITVADMQIQIQAAYDMVDRRQNDAALKLIDEILSGLEPPNRMEIPAARPTIFDHLQAARRGLSGEHELVPPKAALRSALALVH